MIKIEIKNVENTDFSAPGVIAVVKYFTLKMKRDMRVSFDGRLRACSGRYSFDGFRHNIRLEILKGYKPFIEDLYATISTLLHEIKHAKQYEAAPRSCYKRSFTTNDDLTEPFWAEWYSESETEARAFENANLLRAMKIYKKVLAKEKEI